MAELNCEGICAAAMAIADGYRPVMAADEINAHIEHCPECRQEITELRALCILLDTQKRQPQIANSWTNIEAVLSLSSVEHSAASGWRPFVLLGVLLVGYRLVEMVPDRNLVWLFKLIPVIFVVIAFSYLRENPFKINAELRLEGE
jgi:hypothetical protein